MIAQEQQKRAESLEASGATKPVAQSKADCQPVMSALEAEIDTFLRKVGYQNLAERTDEAGWRYFDFGSAEGRAGAIALEGEVYLRVEAMIMDLPSDGDLILPLTRELLETNFGLPLPGRVSIGHEKVWAEVMSRVTDVHADQVASSIHSTMSFADNIEDRLIKKYGGTSKKRESAGGQAQPAESKMVARSQAKGEVPTDDEQWMRFTEDLALCLSDLGEDEYLVISCKRSNRYVQFAGQGNFGMRAEAAGNAYIEPEQAKLSNEDYAAMSRLGWQTPTGTVSDPKGSPNFYLDVSSPVEFDSLAQVAIRTFRQIYGLSHPGQLQYKSFDHGGTQIRFPSLRLKREN
jgi:hypothetical protein